MEQIQGLVMVYTGSGKGKTTAALGLALRQIGHGGRVLFLQFLKAPQQSGEYQAAVKFLPNLEIVSCGRKGFIYSIPTAEDRRLATAALIKAEEALSSQAYSMLVLDEVHVALELGLISLDDLMRLIAIRQSTHLVLTGRNAPAEVIQTANIVSEVQEIKHDYQVGRQATAGIEY